MSDFRYLEKLCDFGEICLIVGLLVCVFRGFVMGVCCGGESDAGSSVIGVLMF